MTSAVGSEVGQCVVERQQMLGLIVSVKEIKPLVSIQVVERHSRRHAVALPELHNAEVYISDFIHTLITRQGGKYCVGRGGGRKINLAASEKVRIFAFDFNRKSSKRYIFVLRMET